MMDNLANLSTAQVAELRDKIYADWRKLDWEERDRQVARYLRDTHSSLPSYSHFAPDLPDDSPSGSWHSFASSCATMCPPWIKMLALINEAKMK